MHLVNTQAAILKSVKEVQSDKLHKYQYSGLKGDHGPLILVMGLAGNEPAHALVFKVKSGSKSAILLPY